MENMDPHKLNDTGMPIRSNPVEFGFESKHMLKDLIMGILPEGGKLNSCFTCGACASGCPASGLSDMDPRVFVRMLSMGMDQEIMAGNWVWMCTMCNRCVHVCPMQIDIPQLVSTIRNHWPEDKKPQGIVAYCNRSIRNETCAVENINSKDFKFIVADVADDVRQTQKGFETLNVPMDKKGATFFINQNSKMPVKDPYEMAPLWKILHHARIDWTYGSTGWAAENYCMFLANDAAWEKLVAAKADVVDRLGCSVLLNTECGHDFYAVKQGLDKFGVPHSFEIKSIIEYYAAWIREGRLKVSSDWNLNLKIKFTVQDPCQLVRKSYGDFIANELRFVVKQAVGEQNFIDMIPNRSNNYCCGGGGGAMKTDFVEERLNYGKIKLDQILETGASYCITPCNNCHSQISELNRHYSTGLNTVHLWTVLCLAMGILDRNERKYLGRDLAEVGLS